MSSDHLLPAEVLVLSPSVWFVFILRMRVCVLLLCLGVLCWRTDAESKSYLITAPLSLRLDAVETVMVQLFGFSEEVRAVVYLKTSMGQNSVVLAQDVVILNAQNNYQNAVKLRLYPNRLDKTIQNVVLHVWSAEINKHQVIPVSRVNGFLFVQTDKPLYTPQQRVKVRAFSLNEELRPANRSVFLKFKDPDQQTVDIVEMLDLNNGIPTMQNPFKIPVKPKLGLWSIEAAYSNDFTTTAKTSFEVKEYVLPSFTILVEPRVNYISFGNFDDFTFKVSARYLHGAPVADGEMFVRYGYVSGSSPPVIIPSSVTRHRLSSSGEIVITANMEKILSKHEGPKDLRSLVGKYLYIAILLEEDTGGIAEEAEFAAVKFVTSPYILRFVSTPPFIKPGLPLNIQVLVNDHLDEPIKNVQVRLVDQQLFRNGRFVDDELCPESATSGSDGLAIFICNTPRDALKANLKFETANPNLPGASQGTLTLNAVAYQSPNQRYIYIDPLVPGQALAVGHYANIKVYFAAPVYVNVKTFGYMVISKGHVVTYGTHKFGTGLENQQTLNFEITPAMVPSIRLLVYYILYAEGTSELVADSVWIDVKEKCVNGLQTSFSSHRRDYKPKEKIQLDIRANQDGLVALSAVDTALFSLLPKHKDPLVKVLRHIEESDRGCGGGGGRDSTDVFRLAGLTFITNANAEPSDGTQPCTALVRPKRAPTNEEKRIKAASYAHLKSCCEEGMRYVPKIITCLDFAQQRFRRRSHCSRAFRECCEFMQSHIDEEETLVLGRYKLGGDFEEAPSLLRSYFPESWLWEVQPIRSGSVSVSRTLPDSLTTWEFKAIGIYKNGICVADPVQVTVNLPLSVDIPLPYQVVRGEQLELHGSVYNHQLDSITYCVTLTAGPAFCLLNSEEAAGSRDLRSTPCTWRKLPAGGVGKVTFILLSLNPGEHTLTFTLKNRHGTGDIIEKKLRVVPEGVRKEEYSGGTLDPRGIYGLVGLSSFRNGDNSYSMWTKQKPSTWLTALVVNTLSLVDGAIPMDHEAMSNSIFWMIQEAQQQDGSFKDTSSISPNKIMAAGGDATDRAVYLTSFVLIALTRATSIKDQVLKLVSHENSMRSAADYISQHALGIKSVYVKAVATYALTLYDPNSIEVSQLLLSLEKLARQKGNPVVLRYWVESDAPADWLKPDESSAMTVETTAYVLLAMLLKGRIPYTKPILSWLSQDQHYGEGFYSVQDTVLTMQGLTEYKRIVPHTVLNQEINVRYSRKGLLAQVELTKTRPVARPLEVTNDDNIIVSTGFGTGVSTVKLKTVYYETSSSSQKCNFDIKIEVGGPESFPDRRGQSPRLVTCVKYKPPPNEVYEQSSMTVINIQLPTGVEAYLEDLKPFRDVDEPMISHYELKGSTVVIQMDTVPSDIFLCFGFRIRTRFTVTGVTSSVMTMYESQDKGSMCTKPFLYQEQKLQRLCLGQECQCMAVACATYRGKPDLTLTSAKRMEETCRPHILYAYKVRVKSSAAEGDFMTYTATVEEVLKNSAKDFEAVRSLTEIELVKKATCPSVDIQNNKQYLLMGSRGSQYTVGQRYRYRFPIDSEALVELWPTGCEPACPEYLKQLGLYTVDLQILGCL
uniref:Complement C5 n=1 Tax=Cynoglossus semilaevis TaxID=244447 RepID=A0A3P8VKG1_CYNSE